MGRADSGVSRCPHRFQRRRRQLGRRGAPARLPHVQPRLEQGQGVGSDPKSQDFQLLGMSRQHSTGGPCSRGEFLISAGGTTVLQDITLLLSQCEIQALSISHSPGKQPQQFLGYFGRWCGCLLGNVELLLFSWSWDVLWGAGEEHVHAWLLTLQMFPSSAPTGCFSNAFLLFPDLGGADPALPPGDCPGFPRIWIQ